MTRYGTGIRGRMSAVTVSQGNRRWLEMEALRRGVSIAQLLRDLVPNTLTAADVDEIVSQRTVGQSIDKDQAQLLDCLLHQTQQKHGEGAELLNRSSVMDYLISKARGRGKR